MYTVFWTLAAILLEILQPSKGLVLFFLVVVFSVKDILVKPLGLLVLYLSANYALGALIFENGLIKLDQAGLLFEQISTTVPHIVLLLYMGVLLHYSSKIGIKTSGFADRSRLSRILAFVFLVLIALVGFDASLIGGSGDVRIVPFMLCSIVFLSGGNSRKSFILNVIVVLVLASTFAFESKREFAFLAYMLLIIYRVRFGSIKVSVFKIIGLMFVSIGLIMAFTILRGYGAYNLTSLRNFVFAMGDLIYNEMSWEFIASVLEIKSSYFYTVYPIASICDDTFINWSILSIFKPLYILPGLLGFERPESFSTMFTMWYNRSFWQDGGSLPPGLIAEYFFVFRLTGIFLASSLVIGIVSLFTSMINARGVLVNTGIFGLSFLIFFLRGSGLDLFLIYCGLFSFFSFVDEGIKAIYRSSS